MKYCPTCQRKFPDLISMCPTDQSDLVQGAPPEGESKPLVAKAGAAAAPAAAKEPIDTRTLEEKLFAPLPKRAPEEPAPAPSVKIKAQTPPVAKPAPGSTTKMMETVYEDAAPQKSSKIAAVRGGQEVPWNKIVPAVLAVVVIVAAFFIFGKSSEPATTTAPNVSTNSKDVDLELSLRDTLAQNAAMRNQDIDIRVKDGTVTLSGEASSAAKIEQAVKAAKAMAGVRDVINHLQINPNVGVRSQGHNYSAGALQQGAAGTGSEHGLAEQTKAHELTLAGDRAASHGDYKSAASFYKQALALNPDDTAASMGYTQVMEKLQ
jgi:BON domain-containing protein